MEDKRLEQLINKEEEYNRDFEKLKQNQKQYQNDKKILEEVNEELRRKTKEFEKLEDDIQLVKKDLEDIEKTSGILETLNKRKASLQERQDEYEKQEPRDKNSKEYVEWSNDLEKIKNELVKVKGNITRYTKNKEQAQNEIEQIYEKYKIKEERKNDNQEEKKGEEVKENDSQEEKKGEEVKENDNQEEKKDKKEKTNDEPENNREDSVKKIEKLKYKKAIAEEKLKYFEEALKDADGEKRKEIEAQISNIKKVIEGIDKKLKDLENDSKSNNKEPKNESRQNNASELPVGEIPKELPQGELVKEKKPNTKGKSESRQNNANELPMGEIPKELPQGELGKENKALQPLYWQVYNKVATEKCSSPARALYNLSKITVFPWNQDMSTPEKFLSAVGTIYRAPMKLIGYLGTKITGTDKKFAKMKEAVDNLTPEEFSVLMDTPEESARKFGREVKSIDDDFSLTFDTMKQYKHNTLALDAIGTRLKTETNLTLSIIEQQKADRERISKELMDSIAQATPDQQAEINKALQICNQDIAKLTAESKKTVEKNDAFFNGLEHRTSKYKDTEGWIFAKFNPDNRTANKEMEKLQKNLFDARQSNDPIAEREARLAIDNFGKSQSRIITVGSNFHNKINRGLYSVGEVEVQNMTPQTIGKQILANIATLGCIEKVLTDIHNIRVKDEAINNNNVNIQNANRYNSNIPYQDTVTKQVNMRDHIQNVDQAEQGMKNVNILASQGMGEHGNLDMAANETNGSWLGGINTPAYSARDNVLHEVTANEVTNGTLDSSFDVLKDVIKTYKPAQEQYAATHNFDYSFMKAMDVDSINSLNSLFKQLSTPIDVTFDISGAVAGVQVAEMADIAYKTMTPALMATMAASQVGHLASVAKEKNRVEKDKLKQQKVAEKEAKKQQKIEEKEARKQQEVAKKEKRAREKSEGKHQGWNAIVRRDNKNGQIVEPDEAGDRDNNDDEEITI